MGCVNFKAQRGRFPGQRNPAILASGTAFSISDVEALTELFKTISGLIKADGKISKEEFKLAIFNDSQRESLIADRIFNLFDIRQKGKIYIDDFITSLGVFHPDTPIEAKIDYAFKVYDLNGNGVIERQEVRDMLTAILHEFQYEMTDEQVEAIIDSTFLGADTNGDGNIDIDEWRIFTTKNPRVLRMMTIPYLREVTTLFPDFVFNSTVEDDRLVRFLEAGASSSTAQPAAQPGAAPSTAQPECSKTAQHHAQPVCSTSTAQPDAQPECSTSTAQPECSTSTVQPDTQPECSTSTTQHHAQPVCSTSTAQPDAQPECSTLFAQHDAQPGSPTSTAQPDDQPECSTSTAQPGGPTSAAQPDAQPRRSSSTSSDEFKPFF